MREVHAVLERERELLKQKGHVTGSADIMEGCHKYLNVFVPSFLKS